MAGGRQLVEDALHAVHNDRARDLLRVEGHEGARRRARTVIGRIATVQRRVAGEAAQAARGVRAHAAQRLVHEEVDGGLAVLDGVDVIACVGRHMAGARGMVEAARGRQAPPARAQHLVLKAFGRVAHAALVATEGGARRAARALMYENRVV